MKMDSIPSSHGLVAEGISMADGVDGLSTASGVKVFGSAVVRVAPDMASIVIAVSRLEQKPEAAFSKARQGAERHSVLA